MELKDEKYIKISFCPKDSGCFTREQVRTINDVVSNHSNSTMDLILDLPLSVSVPAHMEEEVKGKLIAVDLLVIPRGSCIKEVKVCPECSHGVGSYRDLGRRLNEELMGQESPAPIRISVSGCGCRCGMPMLQDIGIVAGLNGYTLYIGGNPYGKPTLGEKVVTELPEDKIIPAINALLAVFGEQKENKKYLYEVVKKVGIEDFSEAIKGIK